jgi:hypothetical protein
MHPFDGSTFQVGLTPEPERLSTICDINHRRYSYALATISSMN